MQTQQQTAVHVRWATRRDFDRVLDIERRSFEHPWDEAVLTRYLRQCNCIGMVAVDEHEDRILGYMVYELHKKRLHLLNIAVDAEHRRQGIGRAMVDELKSKLSANRRSRITLQVRESNLDAQLFFASQGFRATGVLWEHFDNGEDAYTMELRHGAKGAE